jgi:tRNA threonylcarbamoyladenosine biosynthesis protein TsaE
MGYTSNNPKDTAQIAKEIAKNLIGGDILGLIGNLGAGKTTFTQALGKALGIKQNITSPTFVLMKIYPVSSHPTIKQLCHIDAYRITGEADLLAIGAQDYIGEPDTLAIIEWADRINDINKWDVKKIEFQQEGKKRIINY